MSLSVQTNIEAFDAHRNLVNTSSMLASSMQKLSSGYRINKAADDAAGLAISEKLSAQVSGLTQAQQNAQSAVNLVQTADGAMGEVTSMLQRVRDLAVEYNNGTLSSSDQAAITAEVAQLCNEISSIGTDTQFNGIALLTGTAAITFQVGANDNETISTNAVRCSAPARATPSTRRSSRSRARRSTCRRSTPPSRTCPPIGQRSAPSRTGSSTR